MPYRSYVLTQQAAYDYTIFPGMLNYSWSHGERGPDGELILLDQGLTREKWEVKSWNPTGDLAAAFLPNSADPNLGWRVPGVTRATQLLEAETYARLRGKLYKGSAALGVTLGSWKQSQEMIVNSYKQIGWGIDTIARETAELRKNYKRRNFRHLEKKLASKHLEIVFGWQPLVQDILAAATTVIHTQPKVQRVSARSRSFLNNLDIYGSDGYARTAYRDVGVLRVTRAATVEIANPNLWLIERAGLLNAASVGWDLVPWSFVVNWFVNVNQLVQSITDFAGLTFPSSSITYRLVLNSSVTSYPGSSNSDPRRRDLYGHATYRCDSKYRYLNGLARPPLVFKLPDVNWGLAAIAASLTTQKLGTVSTILKPFLKK